MHAFLSLAPALALLLGQTEPAEPTPAPAPEPAAVQEPAAAKPAEPPPAAEAPRPGHDKPAAEGASPSPAPPPPTARPSEPERAQVARAALAFLDALVAGDAGGVAAASSDRFSFDGDVRTGRDEVRRAWRTTLASRDPAQRGALLDLEVLPGADALARLGTPPARLAQLAAQKGVWVAIANVSRRPVILFVAREAGRFAVIGME